MILTIEQGPPAVSLAALKDYLKISLDEEDAALTALIHVAAQAAERFLGQLVIVRTVDELLPAERQWRNLAMRPVRSITAVAGVPAEGAEFALPVENYAIDIDANGVGWLRTDNPGGAGRIHVTYAAGLASGADGVPQPVAHAITRLAGELHARRDGLEPEVPASVAALLRPWRRVRIG